jgi:hypothetical protein
VLRRVALFVRFLALVLWESLLLCALRHSPKKVVMSQFIPPPALVSQICQMQIFARSEARLFLLLL